MTRTLLIADDEKLDRILSMVTPKWSGEILTAMTTEDAMKLIDEHPEISCAFIDYYIPMKLGPAIIQHLKKKNPQAHIALVTSSSSDHVAEEARAAGAEAVVCTSHQGDLVEKQLSDLLHVWSQ